MLVTVILTFIMCAMLFGMIWAATAFYPVPRIAPFMPEDIQEKLKDHKPPFQGAAVIGWTLMILTGLGYIGVVVYVCLDYILITRTRFFQHYCPETEGCAGYHQFGFNRKQQLRQIVTLPFFAVKKR